MPFFAHLLHTGPPEHLAFVRLHSRQDRSTRRRLSPACVMESLGQTPSLLFLLLLWIEAAAPTSVAASDAYMHCSPKARHLLQDPGVRSHLIWSIHDQSVVGDTVALDVERAQDSSIDRYSIHTLRRRHIRQLADCLSSPMTSSGGRPISKAQQFRIVTTVQETGHCAGERKGGCWVVTRRGLSDHASVCENDVIDTRGQASRLPLLRISGVPRVNGSFCFVVSGFLQV